MIDKKMESKKKEPDIKKEDYAQNNKDQIEINNKNLDKVKDLKNIQLSNEKTSNEIVDRGLLEKIFGGVGTQQEIPTSP